MTLVATTLNSNVLIDVGVGELASLTRQGLIYVPGTDLAVAQFDWPSGKPTGVVQVSVTITDSGNAVVGGGTAHETIRGWVYRWPLAVQPGLGVYTVSWSATDGVYTGTAETSVTFTDENHPVGLASGIGAVLSVAVTASSNLAAGLASGVGQAQAVVVASGNVAIADPATGIGAALAPGVTLGAAPVTTLAAGTGAAPTPVAKVGPNAGVTQGTGAAYGATIAISVAAGNAAGTGAAGSATVFVPVPARLYLSNWTPGFTPTTKRGAWDASAATVAAYFSTGPVQGTATTSAQTETNATLNYDVLLGRWISSPIRSSATIAGTVTGVLGALESSASGNEMLHVHIYVTTGDTDTPRGTILTDSIGAVEFPTTAAGITFASTALSSLAVTAGDRIVIEIGSQSQEASATSRTSTIRYGGASATDLADAGTSTANPGWFEFSDTNAVLTPIIKPVGALASVSNTGTTTLAITTVNVGDLVVVGTNVDGGTVTVTGVSGSKTTGWTRIVGPLQGTGGVDYQDMWMGTVTSAGSETLTFTTSGSVGSLNTSYTAKQFTSKFGASTTWAVDGSQTAGTNQTASTTVTFPTLTAAAAGELYVGYAVPVNNGQAGTTAEFQYEIDALSDIFIYNTNLAATSYTPTATQSSSGTAARMAAILKAS